MATSIHRFALHLPWVLVCVVVVTACGSAPRSASPSPLPSSPASRPEQTAWPVGVPSAVLALGAADNEIRKAGVDISEATQSEDLARMEAAADGLARLIEVAARNVPTLREWVVTRELADGYAAAFRELENGAIAVRDGIRSGTAEMVVAGSQQIADGLRLYGRVRVTLSDLIPEALRQNRARVR